MTVSRACVAARRRTVAGTGPHGGVCVRMCRHAPTAQLHPVYGAHVFWCPAVGVSFPYESSEGFRIKDGDILFTGTTV